VGLDFVAAEGTMEDDDAMREIVDDLILLRSR
jgi:hypothetical protein